MKPERWKVVKRLLEQQVKEAAGPWLLAVAPDPLDVVLYETPVLVRSQPPQNPLRGFVQEAVTLRERPTATEIAALLHLPVAIVELVLGNLQQMGAVACDSTGRWSVPPNATRIGTGSREPIWRRSRRLLCYWPERQVLLPVLPRMRLRDLVQLGVHKLQGDVAEWYRQIASWPDAEATKRGRSETLRVLPLRDAQLPSESSLTLSSDAPDAPVLEEEVLVSCCRLDVVALIRVSYQLGVWEAVSRLWSRPTPSEDGESVPYAPGEPLSGLSLVEQLLGGGSALDDLRKLFDPDPQLWRELLDEQEGLAQLRRELNQDAPALVLGDPTDSAEAGRWRGLYTPLSREARLLCFLPPHRLR